MKSIILISCFIVGLNATNAQDIILESFGFTFNQPGFTTSSGLHGHGGEMIIEQMDPNYKLYNGLMQTFNATVSSTSNNDIEAKQLNLFPNPATSYLQLGKVNLDSTKYYIYTMNGNIVANGILNTNTLEISMLPEGSYVLQVICKKEAIQHIGQFIKIE